MTKHFRAVHEPSWLARITRRYSMSYREGPSTEKDRPAHVRAASGLSAFREYIAVIQDDANWLALVDADQQVTAVPLPPSPHGDRIFSKKRGNRGDKYDLEACVTVENEDGLELVGFSSGSRHEREWLLRVRETGDTRNGGPPELSAEFVAAPTFYAYLRDQIDFCGAGLNIEGALSLGTDVIRLFQRGNAEARDECGPVDATADISWTELCRHVAKPEQVPPPSLQRVQSYDLGEVNGVRLTFSDAEHLEGERVLYSASAEDPESGEIKGSVLGIIEADGQARWTDLLDEQGKQFTGKIEGLTRDLNDPTRIHFVIDDDDEDTPSLMFEAVLSNAMLEGGEGG